MRKYGFLSIDDRHSGGELTELNYFTCPHCNRVVTINPKRIRPRHFCIKCNKNTCDEKFCTENCLPFVPILMWGSEKDRARLEATII